MNSRREFLTAGSALAGLAALPAGLAADQSRGVSIYLHGMVWNRQLAAPMNDWLIRLDAKADILFGHAALAAAPGSATLGDDFHDGVGSHVEIRSASLREDRLTLVGNISESKDGTLVGQTVRIEGRVRDTAVEGLTVHVGEDTFSGAGLLVIIAIIAVLIG